MVKFGIIHIQNYSKIQWKNLIKKKIRELNKKDILQQIESEGYKKLNLETMKNDSFELKPYMKNLNESEARLNSN